MKYIIFILGILLIPGKSIYIEFIMTTIWILMFSMNKKMLLWEQSALQKMVCGFILFIFISSAARFFIFTEINFRDFLEGFRFLPLLLLCVYKSQFKNLNENHFIWAFLIYVGIDSGISYLQLTKDDIFGIVAFVKTFYNAENHFDVSLGLSLRTLGLSTGPGDHGAMMVLSLSVFIYMLYQSWNSYKWSCLIGIVLSFYGMITSQSRTSFVAVAAMLIFINVVMLLSESYRKKIIGSAFLIICFLSYGYFVTFLDEYKYLFSLFSEGTNINSYQLRLDKWTFFLNEAIVYPEISFIGYGKDFFGGNSGAMDSDYVYLFLVYGWCVGCLFLVGICYLFYRFMFEKEKNLFLGILCMAVVGGLVIAWAAAFFFSVKIFCSLGIMILKSYERRLTYG